MKQLLFLPLTLADFRNHLFASCIITVPAAEVARISNYKVSVYIDEAKEKK